MNLRNRNIPRESSLAESRQKREGFLFQPISKIVSLHKEREISEEKGRKEVHPFEGRITFYIARERRYIGGGGIRASVRLQWGERDHVFNQLRSREKKHRSPETISGYRGGGKKSLSMNQKTLPGKKKKKGRSLTEKNAALSMKRGRPASGF